MQSFTHNYIGNSYLNYPPFPDDRWNICFRGLGLSILFFGKWGGGIRFVPPVLTRTFFPFIFLPCYRIITYDCRHPQRTPSRESNRNDKRNLSWLLRQEGALCQTDMRNIYISQVSVREWVIARGEALVCWHKWGVSTCKWDWI